MLSGRTLRSSASDRRIREAAEALRPGQALALDRPLTVERFYRILEDSNSLELVNGVIYRPEDVTIYHETAFGWLFRTISLYVEARALGQVFGSRTKMRVSRTSSREPDIVYVSTARRDLLTRLDIAGAADFAVEIVESPRSRREAVVKQAQYQDAGVPEYWVIDLARRELRCFVLEDAEYRELPVDPDGEVEPRSIPGLRLKVAWLFQGPDFPSSLEVVTRLLRD